VPFTVSHIAAVLPLHRSLSRARVFTAAVIGSMVPDFGLLLPIEPGRLQTHSLAGLLRFCLPVGLLAWWITLTLIRPAMAEILPEGARVRLQQAAAVTPAPGARAWPLAGLAVLLGAVTHLAWDAFTHENARGVRMFPLLEDYGPDIDGHPLQLYRWLQYASSVVGLAAVCVALLLWLRHVPHREPGAPRPPRLLGRVECAGWWLLYALLPALAMTAALWRSGLAARSPRPIGSVLDVMAVAGMRASAMTLVLLSALLCGRLALRRRRCGA
jgi:hypothetical protein